MPWFFIVKLTILKNDLSWGLSNISRVITGRGQLPVLSNVLIEATKNGLVLSGTNLDLGMRVTLGGKIEEEGSLTVPAKTLTEFVSSIIFETVEITTQGDKLKLVSGKQQATLAGIPAAEFPIIPKMGKNKDKSFVFPHQIISEIATSVAYAASSDESKPVLTGVRFQGLGSSIVVVATDGFRLAKKTIKIDNATILGEGLILPARTIVELSRLVESSKDEVSMTWIPENNQVIFGLGEIELVSRILQGNFPDTEKIIPKDFKTELKIDREELLKDLRAAGIFARENSNIVKFSVQGLVLRVQASGGQIGENESEIEIETEGEDLETAFNFKYLLDFLNSVVGERITMRLNEPTSAAVLGVDGQEDLVALIMPVRV